MRFQTLAEWLAWQETLHPASIDMSLDRCSAVAARMGLLEPSFPVLTVAGTNGKGSCVMLAEAILGAAGYRVGSYLSPHLQRYNERIRVAAEEIRDKDLMHAFEHVDRARGDVSLTYFEFGTLAAMYHFVSAEVDVAVLEVGLGGRLDAVNVFDADVALIASVGMDHVEWLGDTREAVGREKAGVFRAARPAVYAEPEPPRSVLAYADALGTPLHVLGNAYRYTRAARDWSWHGPGGVARYGLPPPALHGARQHQNAAAVLMALHLVGERIPVPRAAVDAGLRGARLRGRMQVFGGQVERIVDVAHNVHAAQALAQSLQQRGCTGRTHGVFGALADKDVEGIATVMATVVDEWYTAGVPTPRGASAAAITRRLAGIVPGVHLRAFTGIAEARAAALAAARPGDRVLVFGCFHAAATALRLEGSGP